MFNELIQKDIDALEKEKSNDIRKYNILNILNNLGSIFTTDTYLHCQDVPTETEVERRIAKRIKLRKERFDEIKRKGQNINNELFKVYFTDYQSQSNMYKKLSETKNTEINKTRVNLIYKVLSKLYTPKDDAANIEENEKIIYIVERILQLNNKIQSGQVLQILTPNQRLNRLPITLPQLKAGNNSERLKNEIRQLLHSLY